MATVILIGILLVAILLAISNKEKFICYFMFLYPILPEYLSISLSASLPLFTASRLLLLVFLLLTLFNRKIKVNCFKDKYFGRCLMIYFLCETFWFIAHYSDTDSLKTYIGVLLENIIFLIVLFNNITSKSSFNNCLKSIAGAAIMVFILGASEPLTKVNLSKTFLDTGARDNILSSTFERYNSIRAVFSFGHAIALAVYCVAILPLISFYYKKSNKRIYMIGYFAGIACLFMTMSRGIIFVFVIMFILELMRSTKEERINYFKIIGSGVFFLLIVVLCIPEMRMIATDSFLGMLNAFGAHFSVGSSGGNDDAILSRVSQLTMVPQVLKINPLFGGGTGYINKNIVNIYLSTRSFRAVSIDVQYLSMLINQGIIGLIGGLTVYYGSLLMNFKLYKKSNDEYSKMFFLSLMSVYISYFTVAELTTGRILWLMIGLSVINVRLNKQHN